MEEVFETALMAAKAAARWFRASVRGLDGWHCVWTYLCRWSRQRV